MKFTGLNYYTNYSYKRSRMPVIHRNNSYCFSSIYSEIRNGAPADYEYVDIRILKRTDNQKDNYDHVNLLTIPEFKKYLKWIKELSGAKIRVSWKPNYHVHDSISVRINLRNQNTMSVKTLPALVRNVYEFPFNLATKLAFLMEKDNDFKHLSFSERYTLAMNICGGHKDEHSTFSPYNYVAISTKDDLVRNLRSKSFVNDFVSPFRKYKHNPFFWTRNKGSMQDICDGEINDNIRQFLLKIIEEQK